MSEQTRRVKVQEEGASSIKTVVRWDRVEDYLHGMDSDDQFTGWMRSVDSLKAWNIDTKESVTMTV